MKKLKLLDKIDEVRANSVTPEEFKQIWGLSLEEHVNYMMNYIGDLKSKAPVKRVAMEFTKERLQPAAIPAAAAKEKTAIMPMPKNIQKEIRKSLSEDINNLVEKILTENNQNIEFINVEGIGGKENIGKIKLKKRMLSYKKDPISWKLKLVAVKEESEKSISTGTPMVLRNLSYPDDDMSIVARKLSLKKKMLYATPITKSSGDVWKKVLDQINDVQVIKPTKGVNILSVDVGRLDIGHGNGRNALTPGTFKSGK